MHRWWNSAYGARSMSANLPLNYDAQADYYYL
jgi:hypothetical protein